MKRRNNAGATETTSANLGFEAQLWAAANALRLPVRAGNARTQTGGSMDAAEYLPAPRPCLRATCLRAARRQAHRQAARQAGKHVVLGLIFLKYISDACEAHHAKLEAERDQGADPEDPDLPAPHACLPDRQARQAGEYRAENIFWVPAGARWSHLKKNARQPTTCLRRARRGRQVGQLVDDAMEAVERDNPSLKGVLPEDYAWPALDRQRLGNLGQFASAEGKKGTGNYRDMPGFRKSATLEDIRQHGHLLPPGRYVGAGSKARIRERVLLEAAPL